MNKRCPGGKNCVLGGRVHA